MENNKLMKIIQFKKACFVWGKVVTNDSVSFSRRHIERNIYSALNDSKSDTKKKNSIYSYATSLLPQCVPPPSFTAVCINSIICCHFSLTNRPNKKPIHGIEVNSLHFIVLSTMMCCRFCCCCCWYWNTEQSIEQYFAWSLPRFSTATKRNGNLLHFPNWICWLRLFSCFYTISHSIGAI